MRDHEAGKFIAPARYRPPAELPGFPDDITGCIQVWTAGDGWASHSPTTHDAAVRLVADGAAIRPVEASEGTYRFVVPRDVRLVSLESRSSMQGRADFPGAANRRLGLRVKQITIGFGSGEVVIPADDPRLIRGWHDTEREGLTMWRWTDGSAQLPWSSFAEPVAVTIRCSPLAEYPLRDEELQREQITPGAGHPPGGRGSGDKQLGRSLSRPHPDPAAPAPCGSLRLQWCVGMYSSGSTWVFNAVASVGNVLFPGEPYRGVYAESLEELPPGWLRADRLIVKSHHSDEAATALLLQHADRIWVSVRDPRDCVASASTYLFADFEAALHAVTRSALHCERLISDPRSIVLRYEDGFIDDPETFDRFGIAMSGNLLRDDRDRLFQRTRRKAIEAMIQELAPTETVADGFAAHRVHMPTQWHTHHLNRTGEVGRWRHTLDSAQTAEVHRRLGPWMQRFGYQP